MATKKIKTRQAKGLRHHAKRLYHLTPRFVHGMVIGGFAGIVAVMTFGPFLAVSALSISSPRDCDSNAVITCGALNTTELKNGYGNRGVPDIYAHFGISFGDIQEIDKYVAAGRVYKNGDVMVGNTLVATGAVTAGRENISGSTKVYYGQTLFYTRAPSVSFRVDSIAAFVAIKDGEFDFAILAACGNPVKANALVTPKPEPPREEPPEVVPAVALKSSTQTPESTPKPVIVASAELPTTGPGDVILVVCLAIIGGYIYHITHRHIRRRRHAALYS